MDVSEGSTTEDYATCTDNSKRTLSNQYSHKATLMEARKSSKSESSFLTINTSGENTSAVLAKGGSSIESASSFHSLRNDPSQIEELKPPISPTLSESTSSSEGYGAPAPIRASSPRHTLPKMSSFSKKQSHDSISDDCDKIMPTSSHDEKNNTKHQRVRRSRDWTEEERRRKKCNFKMTLEKESTRNGKQLLPEAKGSGTAELHSPGNNQKRFRSKLKKPTRARNQKVEEKSKPSQLPENKIPSVKPEHKTCLGPHKKVFSNKQHLIAASNESLRSISPGSDSVFYETEFNGNNHHCYHCGKEVPANEEESNVLDIVQPPEGFADLPATATNSSKPLKRYRNENKNFHHKAGNSRAKSEERGNNDHMKERMKCADSTPSITQTIAVPQREHSEIERGVYQGNYNFGKWVSIHDIDIWKQLDGEQVNEGLENDEKLKLRRDSTDGEKEFRKKYQAIAHRMVHRRSCLEMYKKLLNNEKIVTDRKVVVQRVSGEFGFRIHGSRPVVISAIEENTPAKVSGLELGDIVLSVNGVAVLEKSHSEVVKIAHAGSDILELEVARAESSSHRALEQEYIKPTHAGYLWKQLIEKNESVWIRRWFCIRNRCLYYFKSHHDFLPIGIVTLSKHKVITSSERPFAFVIQYASNNSKPVILAADNECSTRQWITLLNKIENHDSWLEAKIVLQYSFPPPNSDCSGYLMVGICRGVTDKSINLHIYLFKY